MNTLQQHQRVLEQLLQARIVAIFRGDYAGRWLDFAEAVLQGGICAMEITLNSPGALQGLRELKSHLYDQIILGAGTVLAADEVAAAVEAGANFIVAPDTDESVIAACKQHGVVTIPGAYTPTEIKRAHRLGADIVKLFPAQSPAYVKAVHAPLNHVPLMATGGVDVENAAAYFEAGAVMLGIGSYLTKPNLSLAEVKARAARFVAAANVQRQS